jgi:hypothetical protein
VAHVSTGWTGLVAALGNAPGDHCGDVTVVLAAPVEGSGEFTVPSGSVTIAAEQGALVGVALVLADGRRVFLPGANVHAIIDAPPDGVSAGG